MLQTLWEGPSDPGSDACEMIVFDSLVMRSSMIHLDTIHLCDVQFMYMIQCDAAHLCDSLCYTADFYMVDVHIQQ